MGNNPSPGSQHNVWRHHNLGCSKADNSELETVIRNKFKHSRYYASSGYLQVLKRSEQKLWREPGETIFFRCSRADNSIFSDEIWPKFKLVHTFIYVLVTYKNKEDQMKSECTRIVKTLKSYILDILWQLSL